MAVRSQDREGIMMAKSMPLQRRAVLGLLIGALSVMPIMGMGQAAAFELTSPDVGRWLNKTQEYRGYGCTGQNVSPALSWSGEPAGTKSFALTVFDPDAPTGHGWWHWIVVNLPADVHALPSGASGRAMPAGAVETRTNFGHAGYGGPCPPLGDKPHRYVFTIHALDVTRLDVRSDMAPEQVISLIRAHTIAQASFTAHYKR